MHARERSSLIVVIVSGEEEIKLRHLVDPTVVDTVSDDCLTMVTGC